MTEEDFLDLISTVCSIAAEAKQMASIKDVLIDGRLETILLINPWFKGWLDDIHVDFRLKRTTDTYLRREIQVTIDKLKRMKDDNMRHSS